MNIGAVLWPDKSSQEQVDKIREKYDAHYRLIKPHITILFPVELAFPLEEAKQKISKGLKSVAPFWIRLNRWTTITEMHTIHHAGTRYLLENFPNPANALFLLAEEGAEEILHLKRFLSNCVPQPTELVTYPGYLTLGQTLSDADYHAAQNELADYQPDYRFYKESFDLLQENQDGSWSTVHTYTLGG